MVEVVSGDNWSYNTCKAPVKSSPTNQHPVFYRPDVLPVTQPTFSILTAFSRWTWVSWTLLKQSMMEVVVTTGAIRRVKLQSNHHQQTNIQLFYRPDALPVAQPTASKNWREKYHIPWTCLPQTIAPGYLGEVCYTSHQPSGVSTPSPLMSVPCER